MGNECNRIPQYIPILSPRICIILKLIRMVEVSQPGSQLKVSNRAPPRECARRVIRTPVTMVLSLGAIWVRGTLPCPAASRAVPGVETRGEGRGQQGGGGQ